MRAGFIEKPEVAYFKDVEEPILSDPRSVKIQVKATGICGSEVHAFHGKHPFRIPPVVSGHEFSGVVVEIGKDVTYCKVGDRVTAEPHYGCGHCELCLDGKYNICAEKKVLGANGWSGSFGEYVVVPESTVIKIPDNMTFEQGALIEPLAVGMYAVRDNNVGVGKTVLIIGAGTIGLGAYLCAKYTNPDLIIVADVVDYNLEIAAKMGCKHCVNTKNEVLDDVVKDLTGGMGVDVTILAFGNGPVVEQAARCTKRGGIISEVALMPNGTAAPYALIQSKGLFVHGSNMYLRKDFEILINAISKGLIDPNPLISKVYPIEKMTEAMEMADKRPEPVIKVMMRFD